MILAAFSFLVSYPCFQFSIMTARVPLDGTGSIDVGACFTLVSIMINLSSTIYTRIFPENISLSVGACLGIS